MTTHYVLIDFENVQPATLKMLDQEHVKVLFFVNAKQKLAIDLVVSLQQMGDRAKYIKISGDGPNALDFHIAFYIGQIAALEPRASFSIISKDTGFDPLIRHLGSRITVRRFPNIQELISSKQPKTAITQPLAETAVASPPAAPDSERIARIVADLKKRGNARPGNVQTLANTINALFANKLSDSELEAIIQALRRRRYISVDSNQKVFYTLPA